MIRSGLVIVLVGAAVIVLGPPTLVLSWLLGSPRPLFIVGRTTIRGLLRGAGIRIRVRGRERLDPHTNYLFVANHQSNVDPPVALLAIGRDVRMLAKAELFSVPILGAGMRLAGFVPVERRDPEQSFSAVDRGAEGLRHGMDFVAFPEGTRSRDGRLLPFKKGPFVMAIKAQVPIVPMAIRGTRDMMPKGRLRVSPGVADVQFLDPISTSGSTLEDRYALLETTRGSLARALGDADGTGAEGRAMDGAGERARSSSATSSPSSP